MPGLSFPSACEIAEQIRKRQLSPVEVIEAHLARIAEHNPTLNALVHVDSERALREAKQAEEAVGQRRRLGPLHGVPISIKSSIDVAGMRCEVGSLLRAGYVARKDAPLVERLRLAGAIIVGVTNTPELLMAWETDNLLYGRTNNPWDLSRTAGGSSGGEAAAITAGCSAGGVGSDGGGSIRVPAHFCGICGLKPTPGRVPATGHFPPSAGPFAFLGVVGPMARCTQDLDLIFQVIQGQDFGDTCAAPVSVRWPSERQLRKVRVGYFEDDPFPASPETRDAVRKAAGWLRDAGIEAEPFRPSGLEKARQLWWKWFGVGGSSLLGRMIGHQHDRLSPILREFLGWAAAETLPGNDAWLDTWMERDRLRVDFFEQMEQFPALLCPVAAIPAFRHGERTWLIDGKPLSYLDAWSFCACFNLLGTPAAVLPITQSTHGLPIGVQIVARPWQDELVLSLARIIERQRGAFELPALPAHTAR
ncbi:MAG: amidase [Acidobacteria bacterium]|nr:amidase [Acidobacteriota bacterium]